MLKTQKDTGYTSQSAGNCEFFCLARTIAQPKRSPSVRRWDRCLSVSRLLQSCILGFGLPQNGDVPVGVFPECKEILIGCFRFSLITGQRVCAAELHVCQSTNGIADHAASMIENLLEFRSGLGSMMCGQFSKAANISGVEITGT